jgi:hypothetical protein
VKASLSFSDELDLRRDLFAFGLRTAINAVHEVSLAIIRICPTPQ